MNKKQTEILEKLRSFPPDRFIHLKIGSKEFISEFIIKYKGTCEFTDNSIGVEALIYGHNTKQGKDYINPHKDTFFMQSLSQVEVLTEFDAPLLINWYWLSKPLKKYLFGTNAGNHPKIYKETLP